MYCDVDDGDTNKGGIQSIHIDTWEKDQKVNETVTGPRRGVPVHMTLHTGEHIVPMAMVNRKKSGAKGPSGTYILVSLSRHAQFEYPLFSTGVYRCTE